MLTGFFDLPWWGYIAIGLLLTHLTIVSVTVFLHRAQAHRSVSLHSVPAHFMRFWLWLTTGIVTREWVAIHRKHHAHCDIDEDPHSPQVKGISNVLWRGAELYRGALDDPELLARYGKGTPDDWLERRLYSRYPNLGIGLMLAINLLCFGAIGLTIWALQMLWIPFWAAGVINGVGHFLGYRNFETGDASRNIIPLGLLIGGEELHNNHHAAPSSARLSCCWFEFDIGWFYIRSLAILRLAKVRSAGLIQQLPAAPDGAVNRLQLLRLYASQVILPTLKQERRDASRASRQLLRCSRWLLVRDKQRLNAAQRSRLESSLSLSARLATVYEFQHRLQQIWTLPGRSGDGPGRALQDWCVDARNTGIRALEEFAERLMEVSQVRRAQLPS